MSKAIFQLLKILVFFTPLIFVTGTNELFEFPKMYFVYSVGGTVIWLFLIKQVLFPSKVIFPNKHILFLFGAVTLSTLVSSHPYTSLWGYYTRFNGGLASYLVFIGIYFVIINVLTKTQIKSLIKFSLLSLIPISLYGISQHYSFIANVWSSQSETRVFSTIGQPNWLAAHISMLAPILLLNSLKKHWGWAVLFVASFATIWFTYSLSGLLGFGVGILAFFVLNKHLILKNLQKITLLLGFSFIIAASNLGIFRAKLNDFYIDFGKFFTARAEENKYLVSDPGFIRTGLWKGTLNLALSSPKIILLGTGPETFPYAFQKFRPLELNYSSEWNFVFNKPHNYYLELFSTIGLFGLFAYLLVIKAAVTAKDPIYTPGLVALFVTNFFGWPTVSTALLFWLLLAGLEKSK